MKSNLFLPWQCKQFICHITTIKGSPYYIMHTKMHFKSGKTGTFWWEKTTEKYNGRYLLSKGNTLQAYLMPCYGSFRESLWEIIWKFQLLIICWKRVKNSFLGPKQKKKKLSSISRIRQTIFKSVTPFIKSCSPVHVFILKRYVCESYFGDTHWCFSF